MALLPQLTRHLGQSLFLPAHGRGAALPDGLRQLLRQRAGIWDLPELPALGGPLEPEGAIAESQRNAAAQMGVARCWYGVNGATGLLQAALLAMVRPGERVLLPRNVHRSLIQACVLGDLQPVLFDLPFQCDRGQPAPVDAAWMERVLDALPTGGQPIRAAVLVHPTYQGYANNPTQVIQRLQQHGCCVLVDEAHGCHFAADVNHPLPPSAVHCGADLVVHSLQKSAAALAQTAVLWLQGQRLDPVRVERSLGLLQTTSPSALLLASCEEALQHWQRNKGRHQLLQRLQEAEQLADGLRSSGVPLLNNQDPLRLILHTGQAGITGLEADDWFLPRGLVGELPEPATLTFCLGLARRRGLGRQMRQHWQNLQRSMPNRAPLAAFEAPPLPLVTTTAQSPSEAWTAEHHQVALKDAEGCIAAELLCPYPPGIPLLIPGERLDRTRQNWLQRQQVFWGEQIPSELSVMSRG